MGGFRRDLRRWAVVVAVAATPGLLALEPVAAEPSFPSSPAQEQAGEEPAGRLLPHEVPPVEPPVPTAPREGTGFVPEDWSEPVPEAALLSPEEFPEPVREVVADRDAVTEVWENADGTETVRVHAEPIHFQPEGKSTWERVDNTLVADRERPGWVRNRANGWTVRFGPVGPGGSGGVELVTDRGAARFAPRTAPDAAPVAPVVGEGDDADMVTYPDVWPGVDVVYTVSGGRVKEDIVVSSTERASFPFVVDGLGLTEPASPGASAALEATGAQEGEVAVLPPEVFDANGRSADRDAQPTLGVEAAAQSGAPAGAQVLTVTVDGVWLAARSQAELPVVVDPTVVLTSSYHSSYKSDGTVFSQDGLRVGNPLDAGKLWQSAAAFGYWSSLAGKQAIGASLKLTAMDGSAVASHPVSVWWACSGSYAGATCNNDTSRRYAQEPVAGPGSVTTFDVGQLMKEWQFFGVQTGIFGFSGANTSGVYTFKRFQPPVLTLVLNNPVTTPPALVAPADKAPVIHTLSPTLTWNAVPADPDGDPITYLASIATGSDGLTGLVAASSWISGTSWQVPAGVLRDGVTYWWRVFVTDGHSWTVSPVRSLTVDRRLGAGGMSPVDGFAGITTNLVTGNAAYGLSLPEMPSVGGGISLGLVYNSQAASGGLAAEYRYDVDHDAATAGIEASDPVVLARSDPQVSFDWRSEAQGGQPGSSTAPSPGVPEDWFTVRWTGYVELPAGNWQFGERVDDGIRVWVDDLQVLNDWSQGGVQQEPEWQTGSVAGGTVRKLRVEFREATGAGTVELWVRDAANPATTFVVPASWLSADPRVLPAGWSLQAADMMVAYTRTEVSDGTVTLYSLDGSALAFTQTAFGLAYKPPEGVEDVVTVNNDGTVTVVAEDGYTYLFRVDGSLESVTSALDDRKPAATTSTFDSSGRLVALSDPVSGRQVTLTYGESPDCPVPNQFLFGSETTAAPAGMLCKVAYWDGTQTDLYYKNGQLAWVGNPGTAFTGFGYDTAGRLASVSDPLTFDAVWTGNRTDYDQLLTQIAYDGQGRVASVTAPAPSAGDPRPARSHTYSPTINANGVLTGGTATVSRAGISGTYRSAKYDGRARTTEETNALGQTTKTTWNAEDLVTAVEEPDGLRTTTFYNTQNQPIHVFGPAPASMFNPDGTPKAGQPVPHNETRYDEGINGLAVEWWNNPDTRGIPVLHQHDPAPLNSNWGSGSPAAGIVTPDNFSGRFTGELTFPTAGNYTLRLIRVTGDRVAVYVDDVIALYKWLDTSGSSDDIVLNNVAVGAVKRLRIDYADVTGNAQLRLQWMTAGSGSFVDVPGSALRPDYGLATSTVDPDGKVTETEYTDIPAGIGPHHGLAVRAITDPGGLALTETTGYESVGSGYLRQVSRTLPAGAASTTTTSYYGDAETRDNPCTTANDPANQGGQAKLQVATDPDGAGAQEPIRREAVYDAAGRPVAQRVGTEPWTCTSYDGRGRVTKVEYPAFGGQPARTITTNYVADPDGPGPKGPSPFVTATTDPVGTITAESDLAGQVVGYTDVFGNTTTYDYDQAGRQAGSQGPVGAITKTYDNADRLTSLKRNNLTLAEGFTYDPAGRLTLVVHPSGAGKAGNGSFGVFGYDTHGQLASVGWVGNGWSQITSDAVTRNLAGKVVGQIADDVDHHAGDDYIYDHAGRLVDAWVPGARYNYSYEPNPWCVAVDSYKNTNRTSQTVTPTGGSPTTTGYCYDHADRLYYANDPTIGNVGYDAHGNATTIFGETHIYDGADRHMATTKGSTTVSYVRDATDRIVERKVDGNTVARYGVTGSDDAPEFTTNAANQVLEVTYSLPGGVLLTTRAGGNVWSYPNSHGDLVATANQSGVKQGATRVYDPYGNLVTGQVPDNSPGNFDYGWLGQHKRLLEHEATLQPIIEMGARQYSPLLGRFLEVDPIEGGSANDYDYVRGDPINSFDVTGLCESVASWCIIGILKGKYRLPYGFYRWLLRRYSGRYNLVVTVTIDGRRRRALRIGSCSGGLNWVSYIRNACKVHDLGYNLLRFFARVRGKYGWRGRASRAAVDYLFGFDAWHSCDGWAPKPGCRYWASVAYWGVVVNSIRQGYGVP